MRKGSYLLLIEVGSDKEITVGRLGPVRFPAGLYVYAGSAQGGLESRLGRHFSHEKKLHWHVDHLLDHGTLVSAFFIEGEDRECQLNQMVSVACGAEPFCVGFGSSDCDCATHLHKLPEESIIHLVTVIEQASRSN